MGLNNSFKTSWMILCFGAATVLFSAARQESESISSTPLIAKSTENVLLSPYGTTNSTPSQQARTQDNISITQSPRQSRLGVDSPFPLAPLLIQDSSDFRPETLKRALPITPQLTKTIAALHSRLVVDLSDAKVYSYWGDKLITTYPIAVGQPGWETPTGNFKVLKKQRNPVWRQPITGDLIPAGPDSPLGDRWIGFWADEHHQIGFHGTNKEDLIGQAISHGCLRMRNADIRALYEQVSIGTPVVVRK